MAWKDLRIGVKLGIGFGILLMLVIVGGLVGYSGLKTVSHSLVIVGDEEAPVVDTAMEMKISLMEAMTSTDEFAAATAVLATDDDSRLQAIEANYRHALDDFDKGVSAITTGGDLDGIKVIATDNVALAGLVQQAGEIHDKRYQPAADKMMMAGREMLVAKKKLDSVATRMETVFSEVMADSVSIVEMIGREIGVHSRAAGISDEARAILSDEVPLADMAMEAKYALAMSAITLEGCLKSQDIAVMQKHQQEYQGWLNAFDEKVMAILKGGTVDGTTIVATDNAEIRKAIQEMDQNHTQFQEFGNSILESHKQLLSKKAELETAMAALDVAGEEAQQLLGQVEEMAGAEMQSAKLAGHSSSKSAITWQLVVVGSSLVIGGLLGFVITRAISGPVRQGVAMADEIAKGDFSQRLNLDRKDEVGLLANALDGMAANLQKKADLAETIADGNLDVKVELASEKDQLGLSLQRMTDSLNEIFSQVQTASEQIATGGGQVSDASQSLSQGATESAASLEEITSSMNLMAGQTKQNAENSRQANLLSDEARDAAEKGNEQMQSMVRAMVEINDASQNISRIIKTIDEIAFQTNLLALNAAVEAARAGQHGKGFAVVAEEVRNLAARSAKAAEETAELIEGSVEKTGNGTQIANQTATALEEIVSGIGKVSDLVSEISASSNEQADGISQVDQGLTQIDQVTQQNTASAEESAAAAEELAGQAESLRHLMSRFKLRQNLNSYQQPAVRPPATPISNVGWGDMVQSAPPAEPDYPQVQISLDDSDFGKY